VIILTIPDPQHVSLALITQLISLKTCVSSKPFCQISSSNKITIPSSPIPD